MEWSITAPDMVHMERPITAPDITLTKVLSTAIKTHIKRPITAANLYTKMKTYVESK